MLAPKRHFSLQQPPGLKSPDRHCRPPLHRRSQRGKHDWQEVPSRIATFRQHKWDRKFSCEEVPSEIANFRSPLKISGRLKSDRKFFRRKYWAECGFPVVTPFGDYNIIGGEDGPEISPWRPLQHCTGAPWPNGNRTSRLIPRPLRSGLFIPGG